MNKIPHYSLILLILVVFIMGFSLSKNSRPAGTFYYYQIELNESSCGVLQLLPGVGKKTALAIILQRKIEPFKNWDDFKNRIRLSKSKYSEIKKLCVIR